MNTTKSTVRRLLLAKQLFLHGLDHSRQSSPLDKMIAVHNFHNALEITLRAIMLDYDIRPEKELNIEFEAMLNAIAQAEQVKNKGIKLPYRQDLRNLNNTRNLVQHHGHEPETATMEDWRVLAGKFLKRTFQAFFDVDFDQLTTIEFIVDPDLKSLMVRSEELLKCRRWKESVLCAKVAFEAASGSLRASLPAEGLNSSFFATAELHGRGIDFGPIENSIKSVFRRIRDAELFSAVISTGVAVADYKRLEAHSPYIIFTFSGGPIAQGAADNQGDTEEDARWTLNFCCDAILTWQTMGLQPNISHLSVEGLRKWLAEFAGNHNTPE